MPIPTSINDLSATPGANFPAGSDSPDVIDNVFREHAAYIAQLRDRTVNAADVGYMPAGAGTATRTSESKLREWVTPEDFLDSPTEAARIIAALSRGTVYFPHGGDYDLNGQDITVSNSVTCFFGAGVTFRNGRLRFIPTDAQKRVTFVGSVNFVDASLRVQGLQNLEHTDPFEADSTSVTFTSSAINVTNIYSTGAATTSIDLWNLKNSDVGVISVTGTAGGIAGAQAVLVQDLYDSRIAGLIVNGGWPMGVQFDSSSLRPAFSACRSHIGFVRVKKSIPDESGDHGLYFHGAYASTIGTVTGTGWGGTIASCADFKFRDNQECSVGVTVVDRMRITADNNYSFFTIINRDNEFGSMTCGVSLAMVATTPGYSLNNVIGNLKTPHISADSNKATQGGFHFTGLCSIGVSPASSTVTAYGLVFRDAEIDLVNSPVFVGNFFTAKDATFNGDLVCQPVSASTTTLSDVRINGAFTHNGASAAHAFDWDRVHVTGSISIAGSGASRTTSANWRFVSSDAVEVADTTFRPETKKYRFVAFSDAVYNSLG